MASEAFYSLNNRKIKNFWTNFKDLLVDKDGLKITVEDILEYTGISRSTFYNYFNDINELFDDFIEYALKIIIEESRKVTIKTNSIFKTATEIYKKGLNILKDETLSKVMMNLISMNNRIIRTIFSTNMERHIYDLINYYMMNSVEGKKINDAKKVYTLMNLIVGSLQVAFEAYVCKKYGRDLTRSFYDFDYALKMIEDGYKKMYQ